MMSLCTHMLTKETDKLELRRRLDTFKTSSAPTAAFSLNLPENGSKVPPVKLSPRASQGTASGEVTSRKSQSDGTGENLTARQSGSARASPRESAPKSQDAVEGTQDEAEPTQATSADAPQAADDAAPEEGEQVSPSAAKAEGEVEPAPWAANSKRGSKDPTSPGDVEEAQPAEAPQEEVQPAEAPQEEVQPAEAPKEAEAVNDQVSPAEAAVEEVRQAEAPNE